MSDEQQPEIEPEPQLCECGHPSRTHCYSDGQLKPWCEDCCCKAFIPEIYEAGQ